MAFSEIHHIRVSGIAACVPKHKVSNLNYEWIELADREKLIKTTGINERRVSNEETCTSDLCIESARKLITELNWDVEAIQIVVFVSQTPDYRLPATSVLIQNRLGLSKNTICFDLSLGCSGYVYGLSVISSMMSSLKLSKGLLLVGDTISKLSNEKDKSVYPLFGDAGTATALEYNEQAEPVFLNLFSDGSGSSAIIVPSGGMRNQVKPESFIENNFDGGITRNSLNLIMEGIDVFNFTQREVSPSILTLLESSNTDINNIDYFVFHQANKMMNEIIRKKLKIEEEKVPYSLPKFGNTSSATLPLTIVSELRENLLNKNKKLLLSGFGVGLSWGNVILNLNNPVIPEILEW